MADRDTSLPDGDPQYDRFTEVPEFIVRNFDGQVTHPPPGPERNRALKLEEAWRRFNRNGDEKMLIEMGIFPKTDSLHAWRLGMAVAANLS